MFHAVVFVMMSRRLSDQSEIAHHERPTQSCRAGGPRQGGVDPPETLDDVTRRQAGEVCPEPAIRAALSLDGKSPVGAGDSTPTGV
jgi:hypothetical protein